MKATDRQLIDISEELTAYIMKPTFNLCLSPDECIILNKLITEEFERRQEQDVMGSSDGQDTPLGQTGADNNDGNINASECRDSEVSGTSLREKKKPQITKVSKKEYWDNRDKHGTYLPTYDVTDQPEVPYLGFMPYPDEHIPVAWMHEKVQQNFMLKPLFYSILSDWDFEADKYEAKGMNLVLYPKWLYIPLPYIVEKVKDPISNSRYRAIIQFWKQDRYLWKVWEIPDPRFPPIRMVEREDNTNEKTEEDTNETSDYPVGSFGYERERLAKEVEGILEKNGINSNETTEETPDPEKYIPIAYIKKMNDKLEQAAKFFENTIVLSQSQKDSLLACKALLEDWERDAIMSSEQSTSANETTEGTPRTYCRDCVHYQGIRRVAGWGECARRQKTVLGDHFSCPLYEHFIEHS